MKEVKQMALMMLGVIAGLALGALALIHIFNYWPDIPENQGLCLLVIIVTLGGGLTGGGYLVQVLIEKYEKWQKRRKRADK